MLAVLETAWPITYSLSDYWDVVPNTGAAMDISSTFDNMDTGLTQDRPVQTSSFYKEIEPVGELLKSAV